jgi:hypothetical protein
MSPQGKHHTRFHYRMDTQEGKAHIDEYLNYMFDY